MSRVLARFVPQWWIQAGLAAGLVLFAAAAVTALLTADPAALGEGATVARVCLWLVVVLCPVFAVDAVARLIRRTPTLVATDEGVSMRSILGYTDPIPWGDIQAFVPEVISKKLWLAIYLRDPGHTLADYSILTRLLHVRTHDEDAPNITLRRYQLGMNPIEAVQLLNELLEKHRGPGRNSST